MRIAEALSGHNGSLCVDQRHRSGCVAVAPDCDRGRGVYRRGGDRPWCATNLRVVVPMRCKVGLSPLTLPRWSFGCGVRLWVKTSPERGRECYLRYCVCSNNSGAHRSERGNRRYSGKTREEAGGELSRKRTRRECLNVVEGMAMVAESATTLG